MTSFLKNVAFAKFFARSLYSGEKAWYTGAMVYECGDCTFLWDGLRVGLVRVTDDYVRGVIPLHSHAADSFELHCVLEGRGEVRAGTQTHALRAGDVYATPGGTAHEQRSDADAPMRELCLYAVCKREGRPSGGAKTFLERPFCLVRADESMLDAARIVCREIARRRAGFEDAVRGCALLLLALFARAEHEGARREPQRTGGEGERFLHIEEAFLYRYRTVTLSALADETGLSPRQLQRVLRERYGMTFSQKKTDARMRAANVMLAAGKLSVARIAEEVGYSCPEHFCAEYKKRFGMTAGAYRRAARGAARP